MKIQLFTVSLFLKLFERFEEKDIMRYLLGAIAVTLSMGLYAQANVKDAKTNEPSQSSKSVLETEAGYDAIISQLNKDLEKNTVFMRQKILVLPAKTILYKGKSDGDNCKQADDQTASDNDCIKLEVFDFQDSEIGKTSLGLGSRAKYMILQFEGGSTTTGDPFKEAPRKVKKSIFGIKNVDFVKTETIVSKMVDADPSLLNADASNDYGGSHDDKITVYYSMGSSELKFESEYAGAEKTTDKGDGVYSFKYVENTKTHPIRNEFKKSFIVKNLLYFRELFANIADYNERAALAKYKRNKEFIKTSLKY